MSKLITWFDVENIILREKFAKGWSGGIVGISVYPDEIQIRLKNDKDIESASDNLKNWFGAKYKDEKIYLESSLEDEPRYLTVTFEIDPEEERFTPEFLKPDFASFSLYPKSSGLKGPDFSKLAGSPSIWAFYSFKGGVSRTLHLISLVKAISELEPDKRVLIVDADLEAPGLTWWGEEQFGKPEISFLDFLTLAHYDDSDNYQETFKITKKLLNTQRLVFKTKEIHAEHYFLPAFREFSQAMRMPIRPENVTWEKGKEWIISELLWELGKELDVSDVVIDLRAGLSEISSPVLFDPRVRRVIITTASSQSVEGTKEILKYSKIDEISKEFLNKHDNAYYIPAVIISMVKEDFADTKEIESIEEEFISLIIPEEDDNSAIPLGMNFCYKTLFDEKLLYLKNLENTLEKLDGTNMYEIMSGFIRERVEFKKNTAAFLSSDKDGDLKKLKNIAEKYEFAESGAAEEFLTTQSLKSLARKFENSIPVAVIMGAKGSGKSYTYLQIARLNKWGRFVEKIIKTSDKDYCYIWPLLTPGNLQEAAQKIIEKSRNNVSKEININLKPLTTAEIENFIASEKDISKTNKAGWRQFWLKLMAASLCCENEENPLEAMEKILSEKKTGIVFLIDGLENHFQNIGNDEVEQCAIQALCQSVPESLRERPGNRIGLLVFIRKDIAKSSIKQNFGQFEALYRQLELKWYREEALRLIAWLVRDAAKLNNYVELETPVESTPGKIIEKSLERLWGVKLGKPNSKEAYTANWVIAALSDFNGQLQARDTVRLIRFAAEDALERPEYKDRLLPPLSIKNALDPCSTEKIKEIRQEIKVLNDIFDKLEKAKDRQIPFEMEQMEEMELTSDDIKVMDKLGVITEYEGKYYLPEIFRRGLNFQLKGGARPKVLTLLKRAQKS